MDYTINIQVVLENGKSMSSSIPSSLIESLKELHNESALFHTLQMIIDELKKETK